MAWKSFDVSCEPLSTSIIVLILTCIIQWSTNVATIRLAVAQAVRTSFLDFDYRVVITAMNWRPHCVSDSRPPMSMATYCIALGDKNRWSLLCLLYV